MSLRTLEELMSAYSHSPNLLRAGMPKAIGSSTVSTAAIVVATEPGEPDPGGYVYYGTHLADFLRGSGGRNETFYGLDNNDTIYTGAGHDIAYGGYGEDALHGEGGDDHLDGGDHRDLIYGGIGNDTILGGSDYDRLYGDSGDDWIYVGVDGGSASGDDGNDHLYGSDVDDGLYGGAGNDTLEAGAGNDDLNGSAGADFIDGGEGIDTVYYGGADDTFIYLFNGSASGGQAEGDTLHNIENVYGSYSNDVIYGSSQNNFLHGGSGNDQIVGWGGQDTLNGSDGNDTLIVNGGGYAIMWGDSSRTRSGDDRFLIDPGCKARIRDFKEGAGTEDKILIYREVFASFEEVMMAARSYGSLSTRIKKGDFEITIDGVKPLQLHADDFMFL